MERRLWVKLIVLLLVHWLKRIHQVTTSVDRGLFGVNADYVGLSNKIVAYNWTDMLEGFSVDDKYKIFFEKYSEAVNLHIPSTTAPFIPKRNLGLHQRFSRQLKTNALYGKRSRLKN